MIDKEGFRANIGIILINSERRVFWGKRVGQKAWQFPQGGMLPDETTEDTLYRELYEEVGLSPEHIEILGCTEDWLYYRLPKKYIRYNQEPVCIGQKQKWYLLRFLGTDKDISLNTSEVPEFDGWRWVHYWYPLKQVIAFKRRVYRQALKELWPKAKAITKVGSPC